MATKKKKAGPKSKVRIELKDVPGMSKAMSQRIRRKIVEAVNDELPDVTGQDYCTYYVKTYLKF